MDPDLPLAKFGHREIWHAGQNRWSGATGIAIMTNRNMATIAQGTGDASACCCTVEAHLGATAPRIAAFQHIF